MAGKINSRAVINELQRSMALKESGAQGPYCSGKRHAGCDGHGCQRLSALVAKQNGVSGNVAPAFAGPDGGVFEGQGAPG